MLLVVDVGNTQARFGICRGAELLEHWRFATVRQSTADQLGAALSNLLELRGYGFGDLEGSIVSSTVPQLEPEWVTMASRYLGHEMHAVGPGTRTGLAIRYDNPREIGADRLVNAVALRARFGGPAGCGCCTSAIVKPTSRAHNAAVPSQARLTDSWMLGRLRVPNRVLLAPLAGIGNWFVRLQAKRYGAGMAVSEMISSHAVHYGNRKTCTEMLRIDVRERDAGPVAIQLFGEDPAIMHSAAAHVARAGADAIDINMGCPVPKVRKTGAGAALLDDPDRAVAVARAAVQGAVGDAGRLPVTVKLRC